jgi:hypothetical protein
MNAGKTPKGSTATKSGRNRLSMSEKVMGSSMIQDSKFSILTFFKIKLENKKPLCSSRYRVVINSKKEKN